MYVRRTLALLGLVLGVAAPLAARAEAATTATAGQRLKQDLAELLRQRAAEYGPLLDSLRKRSTAELEKMTQWEYHVVKVHTADPVTLTDYLNQWGKQGWECFQVVSSAPSAAGQLPQEYLIFLRRRPSSLLTQIPLRDLMRMMLIMIGEGGDGQEP